MAKIKIAIVGCGWFGNVHLDYLLTRDDVSVVAFVNRGEEALNKTAAKVPSANRYTSVDELLQKENSLDAIVLCVPPHSHGDIEIKAAKKGVHLYIEKPLSNKWEQAKSFCDAIEKSGIICSVGYQERYAPGVIEVKNLPVNGEACLISGQWVGGTPGALWWQDKEKSGGQIVEQATHVVDLMRYFAGEAESVFAFVGAPHPDGHSVDSSSVGSIRFKNGTVGSFQTACFLKKEELGGKTLTIYKAGVVEYSLFKSVVIKTEKGESVFENKRDNHARALAAFVEAVKAKNGDGILSTYSDAMETFKLTLALEKSLSEKRVVLLSELV